MALKWLMLLSLVQSYLELRRILMQGRWENQDKLSGKKFHRMAREYVK